MRISYLRHLSCPASRQNQSGRCGGRLQVQQGAIPVRAADDDSDELLEGTVVCEVCQSWYPIFAGVLILVAHPEQYLAQRFPSLMFWAGIHGQLSEKVLQWIANNHFELYESKRVRDSPDSSAILHYEKVSELMNGVPLPERFRAFIEEWSDNTPYDLLTDMARRFQMVDGLHPREKERIAIDAGCGVGGLVSRLADCYDIVFGADLSFTSILVARSILLHRPKPYLHLVRSRRNMFHSGNLDHARRSNVEMFVADCTVLPFADETVNAVVSANVIEIVHPRAPLSEAWRTLRKNGLLLLTDPFKFHVKSLAQPPCDPLEETKSYLASLGMLLVEEQDFVPWIWYEFQRHVQIYFNYCGSFRKTSSAVSRE